MSEIDDLEAEGFGRGGASGQYGKNLKRVARCRGRLDARAEVGRGF